MDKRSRTTVPHESRRSSALTVAILVIAGGVTAAWFVGIVLLVAWLI